MEQAHVSPWKALTWSDEELRRNVGQLFIVGFHDQTPSDHIRTLIQKHHVGAIVLFLRNVASASQLTSLTHDLQRLARESGHDQPLFIGIDQENGLVTRIKPPIASQLPGPMALGATGDARNAHDAAQATGETLAHFGINMNYAPIADINSEPNNPVIGVRSPSDDPEVVGKFVSVQVKALREQGVIPCIKHFPGHGDTAVDSHYGLPVINKSKLELEGCELIPFRRAIAEGVEAVMSAHIALPGIENGGKDGLPASLSKEAITILRRDLGYNGMVVSDCLEMDGVRKTFGTEKGAVMALKAGTDCVMICHTLDIQIGAIEEVVQAVKSGELSQASVEASLARVMKLKTKFLGWPSEEAGNTEILKFMNLKHEALARKLYAQSTTLVRSRSDLLPLSKDAKIVYLSPGEAPAKLTGVLSMSEVKTRVPYTPSKYSDLLSSHASNVVSIRYLEGGGLDAESWKIVEAADAVLLATRNARLAQYQLDLGLELGKAIGDKVIVVATCDPYDFLNETSIIQNYIVIYEPTIPAFESAANVIFGITEATGSLPVCNPKPQYQIEDFDDNSHATAVISLWNDVLREWCVSSDRFKKLLARTNGRHFVTYRDDELVGVCITYRMDEKHAKIAAVIVAPTYRNQGIGTSLLAHARRALQKSMPHLKTVGIGSSFPRFWTGLPLDLPQRDREFFVHRGFKRTTEASSRDLYQDIRNYRAPASVMEKATKSGLRFAPLTKDTAEECLVKQRKNFSYNADWVKMYEHLVAADQYQEVLVVFDSNGSQIGWTLMCSPESAACQDFAFLPLVAPKTGLIACVGVDAEARKAGVGLAMLVSAIENMRDRGIEGIVIDWVVIRGFYEKLGFEVWKEYEGYELRLI